MADTFSPAEMEQFHKRNRELLDTCSTEIWVPVEEYWTNLPEKMRNAVVKVCTDIARSNNLINENYVLRMCKSICFVIQVNPHGNTSQTT